MKKEQEFSERSKKSDILEAYNTLLKKAQEQKPIDRKEERKVEEEKQLVKKVSLFSVEAIVKKIADVKLDVDSSLDSLEQKLLEEQKKFFEVQDAIRIASEYLTDVHEITAQVDSLEVLNRTQQEMEKNFEKEIAEKREALDKEIHEKKESWEAEQAQLDKNLQEKEQKTKKERSREEEEYNYTVKLSRQRDEDLYKAKKEALDKGLEEKKQKTEKDFAEREALLKKQEQRFIELEQQVKNFPIQLKQAVEEAEKRTTLQVERELKFEIELKAKEVQGEKRLFEQKIVSLEEKIKEQDAQISLLTKKADESGRQVQQIAVKAIEGASQARILEKTTKPVQE